MLDVEEEIFMGHLLPTITSRLASFDVSNGVIFGNRHQNKTGVPVFHQLKQRASSGRFPSAEELRRRFYDRPCRDCRRRCPLNSRERILNFRGSVRRTLDRNWKNRDIENGIYNEPI